MSKISNSNYGIFLSIYSLWNIALLQYDVPQTLKMRIAGQKYRCIFMPAIYFGKPMNKNELNPFIIQLNLLLNNNLKLTGKH